MRQSPASGERASSRRCPSASASASPSAAGSTRRPPSRGCVENGALPYAYTADLGQYDEPDLERRARPGQAVRRRAGAPRRLPRRAGPRGADGAAVRRVPHQHRGQDVLQHHAARPGRHRHAAGAGDARRRRRHLGRRQHLQGQRHRALLPLRAAGQPEPADLQAVARQRLRRPSSAAASRDERVPDRPRPAVPRQQGEGVLDRRQHLGRDARGEVARGAGHGDGHRRADHGRRALPRPDVAIATEDVTIALPRGLAGRDQRQGVRRPGRAGAGGQRDRRAPRARA